MQTAHLLDATIPPTGPTAIFTAWLREAVSAIYRYDLGAAFCQYFDARAQALIRVRKAVPRPHWATTAHLRAESCGAVLAPP